VERGGGGGGREVEEEGQGSSRSINSRVFLCEWYRALTKCPKVSRESSIYRCARVLFNVYLCDCVIATRPFIRTGRLFIVCVLFSLRLSISFLSDTRGRELCRARTYHAIFDLHARFHGGDVASVRGNRGLSYGKRMQEIYSNYRKKFRDCLL
jgi:hypothetical protein